MNMNVAYPSCEHLHHIPPADTGLEYIHTQRKGHAYVRLLTAYANGPDRAVFVLRILSLLDRRRTIRPTRHETLLRKTAPLRSFETFSYQQIIHILNALNTTPRTLATLFKITLEWRPVPEIDWETDAMKALLAYARRDPLTVYYELRVIMAVKNIPLVALTEALRGDVKKPSDATMWAMSFLKKLDTPERLQQVLDIMKLTPERLLMRLPQAL